MNGGNEKKIRWQEHWLCYSLLTVLLTFGGLLLGKFTIGFVVSAALNLVSGFYSAMNDEMIEVIAGNSSFLMIPILLFFSRRRRRKKGLEDLWVLRGTFKMKWFAAGCGAGGFMCVLSILVAVLFGKIELVFRTVDLFVLGLAMLAALIQAMAEEVLFRGYFLNGLRQHYSTGFSVIVCSLLFALSHMLSSKITIMAVLNIWAFGVVLAYLSVKRNSLDLAIGIHFMWNYVQQYICGTPNSGLVFSKSVFMLAGGGDSFFYNQGYGVEAAIQPALFWGLLFVLAIRYNAADS